MRQFIAILFNQKGNAPEAAYLFNLLADAKILLKTFEKEINDHPVYPDVLAIKDVHNSHKVDNLTARFEKGKL